MQILTAFELDERDRKAIALFYKKKGLANKAYSTLFVTMAIEKELEEALEELEEQELLNTAQAAHRLRLAPGTLERWRATRPDLLPFIHVGRLIYYRVEDVAAFIKTRHKRKR